MGAATASPGVTLTGLARTRHSGPIPVACKRLGQARALPWWAMCGIVGYVGSRPACDVVVDALRRMEYRGYDSAGIALVDGHASLTVRRRAGRLSNLEKALEDTDPAALS